MGRIERKDISRANEFNSDVVTWETRYEHVPMGIEPLRGAEREAAQQRVAETVYRVVFHYLPEVDQTDRIVDEETGEIFEILEIIDPSTRGRTLELTCTRGMTDG